MKKKKERKQINIRLEEDLHDFLYQYAEDEYKSVTSIIRDMIVSLKKKVGRNPKK